MTQLKNPNKSIPSELPDRPRSAGSKPKSPSPIKPTDAVKSRASNELEQLIGLKKPPLARGNESSDN